MAENVIVTAVGKNRPGVLAELTTAIADLNGNIMDISQKMMEDYFNLLMMVDISGIQGDFAHFKGQLEHLGEQKRYAVHIQHERVFQYMHRI